VLNVKKCMCWCLSIIELKNAWWNIEINKYAVLSAYWEDFPFCIFKTFLLRSSNEIISVTYYKVLEWPL